MKKGISVLWVDDRRNPLVYLKKKPEEGNETLQANLYFYNNFLKKYNPQFTWVKSFEEFKNYILQNGLPDFVSFDRDLGKGLPSGEVCASWLVKYCNEKGLRLPNYYAHTANKNGKRNINAIMTTENSPIKIDTNDINEMVTSVIRTLINEKHSVYFDKSTKDDKKKTISLRYNATNDNNKTPLDGFQDNLKTDKMDNNSGSDVYYVKLKNGFECYNITSINGTEAMHYFKRYWDNKPTDINYRGEKYKVTMIDRDFRDFMNKFINKVEVVVSYHMARLEKENSMKITGLSIYPVDSSSQFNDKMADMIQGKIINNLPVQKIDKNLLVKDMRTLEKDNEFIEKNKKYYNSQFGNSGQYAEKTVLNQLDDSLARQKAIANFKADKIAEELNTLRAQIITSYRNLFYKYGDDMWTIQGMTKKFKGITTILNLYKKYCEIIYKASNIEYTRFDGKPKKIHFSRKEKNGTKMNYYILSPVVKEKGRDGTETLEKIWNNIYKYLKNILSSDIVKDILKNTDKYKLKKWSPVKFQIKNLSNGERMGVKGIYNPNQDTKLVERELEKIKGTALIIFDDNVSGGATLSDICGQCKKLGIENIIPITFGQMNEKWRYGNVELTKPINDETHEQTFNF